MTGEHRRISTTLTRRFIIRQQDNGLDVSIAVADQLARKTIANRNQIDVSLDLVLAQQRFRHQLNFLRRLHVKKGDLTIETPRAFQVNVELVRTIRHHQKQDAPAIRRIGHELLDTCDNARRSAAITFAIGIAERTVTFVDDHHHLTNRANDVQDLLEIAFSRAHPLRAEVFQLDRRQATLFRKRLGHESLSGAHWTSEQNSHRHTAGAPFANTVGDNEQVFLDFVHASDNFKPVRRLDKLDQAKTLALEYLALTFRDQPISLFAREFDRTRQ